MENFPEEGFSVITLLGPTGVGKTTTIAKLAYMLKNKGKRVGLITIDSYRVGAVEQLRTYANIMELPFRIADTPGEKLGLKFTPPVIAISNSISICINKHTS